MNIRTFTVLCLLLILMWGCGLVATNPTNPRIIAPQQIPGIVRTIPSYLRFEYSGLMFFKGKLYASSNIGLLEYEAGRLSRLYKWSNRDDVISGPWVDSSHNSLWMLHEGLGKLIRYDGGSWLAIKKPEPEAGLTRGDVLEGFRGVGNSKDFWLEGAGHAWRWLNDKSSWATEPMPDSQDHIARIIPTSNRILYVMRNESIQSWDLDKGPTEAQTDAVYYLEGQWKLVPNRSRVNYYAEQTVTPGVDGFIRTHKGEVLRVTSSEITLMESPGVCETLAVTSSGRLLASFINLGIYEYGKGWQKKFSAPYPNTEGRHWAYLTEDNNLVAFAISVMPQMVGENRFEYPGQTTLWITNGDGLKAIPLGP
jgi:hypothetical protein